MDRRDFFGVIATALFRTIGPALPAQSVGVLQVQNITSVDDLNAVAAAELARIGGVPTIVDFETDFPGLQPGQLLTVDVPLSGVTSNSLLITQVSGVFIPPTLANGGSFRWQIECRNNLDPGN